MKAYFTYIILSVSSLVYSQLYIGNDPEQLTEAKLSQTYGTSEVPSLIVDDNVLVKGKLIFKEGQPGQVLRSNGPGQEPTWQTVLGQIQRLENLNYLLYTQTFDNLTGINLDNAPTNPTLKYTIDQSLSSNWQVIAGSNQEFTVQRNNPTVYITFESVAHIAGSGTDTGAMFACGIFVAQKTGTSSPSNADFKLKGVRTFTANRGANSDPFFNIRVSTILDKSTLLENQKYEVKIGCTRRENFGATNISLAIGKAATGTSNISNTTARTFLKISRYENTTNQ
ncbi:hypothetical protein [Faecalibacter bovis]|uniref:Uncharacterized protein n=1 Tax=Faecalibacter bovis TaxID=2898187 RepID=A0ABX7XF20_9FLAO|nr:hypothetical protein [Faecalibacter bovis]QTV06494.1 hypothetical protein J9309_04000 [Faecalibacter bovis]